MNIYIYMNLSNFKYIYMNLSIFKFIYFSTYCIYLYGEKYGKGAIEPSSCIALDVYSICR